MNIYQHMGVFADNLATHQYYSIIGTAVQRPRKKYRKNDVRYRYYESHHVLPKSIFPEYTKSPWNTVLLTAEEHFDCHKLLVEMTDGENKSKMICAFWYMSTAKTANMHRKIVSGVEFEKIKLLWATTLSASNTGRECSQQTKDKISIANKGRQPSRHAVENSIGARLGKNKDSIAVEKSRLAQMGNSNVTGYKCWTNGVDDTMSKDCPEDGWNLGRTYKHSDETKRKISEAGMGRIMSAETKKKKSERMTGYQWPDEFGAKISVAKKGKPTNQQEIMGRQYVAMSDADFATYIDGMKSLLAQNRATNLRNKWINII